MDVLVGYSSSGRERLSLEDLLRGMCVAGARSQSLSLYLGQQLRRLGVAVLFVNAGRAVSAGASEGLEPVPASSLIPWIAEVVSEAQLDLVLEAFRRSLELRPEEFFLLSSLLHRQFREVGRINISWLEARLLEQGGEGTPRVVRDASALLSWKLSVLWHLRRLIPSRPGGERAALPASALAQFPASWNSYERPLAAGLLVSRLACDPEALASGSVLVAHEVDALVPEHLLRSLVAAAFRRGAGLILSTQEATRAIRSLSRRFGTLLVDGDHLSMLSEFSGDVRLASDSEYALLRRCEGRVTVVSVPRFLVLEEEAAGEGPWAVESLDEELAYAILEVVSTHGNVTKSGLVEYLSAKYSRDLLSAAVDELVGSGILAHVSRQVERKRRMTCLGLTVEGVSLLGRLRESRGERDGR